MLIKISVHLYCSVLAIIINIYKTNSITNFVERYSHSGVTYYHQLMFDVNNYQLIVGARDYLLRVRLDNWHESRPAEAYYLPADSEKQKLCERKGMKSWQCRNYITVLLPIIASKQVLICGTNAFSPECEIRQLSSLSTVIRREPAISRSAFSPLWNTSSLISQSGDYYYAGPLDFMGIDAAIIRHSSSSLSTTALSSLSTTSRTATTTTTNTNTANKKSILRTLQSDSKWINADANFIYNFEFQNHIYFLFRESAVEYINCGKSIYSRIGRVCKNDSGGQLYYKENWTTFIKSRLNCSIPGIFPFYFNELQSVDWLESSDVPTIYATFNTPENSIHGSAVCAYRIDSVLSSFHGLFKHQKSTNAIWESANVPKDIFECMASPRNGSELHQMTERLNSQFQLMDSAVQAVNGRPYVVETNKRLQFIAVDVIQTKYHNSVEVIFVTTSDGFLIKYIRWPFSTEACLVDEIQLIANSSNDSILSIKLLKDTQSIYLGSKREIFRISVQRCHTFVTRIQCLLSGDPYCGWNQMTMSCTTAPGRNPHSDDWIQTNSTLCPKLSTIEWSEWFDCNQLNNSLGDRCLCRMRSCSPQSTASEQCFKGQQLQVTNCTQNGYWSEWSQWSSCSSSCGSANKTRFRKCSSPAPAFGGRNCRGPEREVIQCMNSPPCLNTTTIQVVESSVAIKSKSHWSEWSQWEQCSAKCGGGVQLRRRRCDWDQTHQHKSQCIGCDVEWRICNRHECQEVKQQSEWTDWLVKNITGDGVVEQRVRFTCRAHMSDIYSVNIQSRVEERFIASHNLWSQCSGYDSCNGWQFKWNGDNYLRRECSLNECMGWSQWSQWTACVYGKQSRSRECDGSVRCKAHYKELRYCHLNDQTQQNSDESHSINSIQDKTLYKSSASAKSGDNSEESYSLQKLLLCSLLSFSCGAIISGFIIYFYMTKNDRIRHMRHQRLSLKLFSSLKPSSNAYESPQDYKSNQSALSPLNNINNMTPIREATIKRSSTIRAKLHSDQNF